MVTRTPCLRHPRSGVSHPLRDPAPVEDAGGAGLEGGEENGADAGPAAEAQVLRRQLAEPLGAIAAEGGGKEWSVVFKGTAADAEAAVQALDASTAADALNTMFWLNSGRYWTATEMSAASNAPKLLGLFTNGNMDGYIVPPGLGKRSGILGAMALAKSSL